MVLTYKWTSALRYGAAVVHLFDAAVASDNDIRPIGDNETSPDCDVERLLTRWTTKEAAITGRQNVRLFDCGDATHD